MNSSFFTNSVYTIVAMFGQRSTGLEALIHRRTPSMWESFLDAPCSFLAHQLYQYHMNRQPTTTQTARENQPNPVRVVCISDTHNDQPDLPPGDILIHAGDLTQTGTLQELQATISWLRRQPHNHKVVIAGNHDQLLDPERDGVLGLTNGDASRRVLDWGDVIYLQDSSVTITCVNGRRLRIYGSPHTPRHGNWAFQYPRSADIWPRTVPDNTDILVTHGPPRAHLDLNFGCVHLLRELWRIRPLLHVFGHMHVGYGREQVKFDEVLNAYERTVIAGGGLWNLVGVARAFLGALFGGVGEGRCMLVNAAIVGGLRDNERREPVVVDI